MKCASCGLELDESLKFCEGCGAPVAKAPAASQPPPPTAPAAPKAPTPPSPKAPPASATPKAPDAPKKKGGKCGCIAAIAIVVLLVLLGLCIGGGFFFWKRGLRDKWESFRHRGEGNARIHAPADPPGPGEKAFQKSFTA